MVVVVKLGMVVMTRLVASIGGVMMVSPDVGVEMKKARPRRSVAVPVKSGMSPEPDDRDRRDQHRRRAESPQPPMESPRRCSHLDLGL